MRLWPRCRSRTNIAIGLEGEYDRCERRMGHLDTHTAGGGSWGRTFGKPLRRRRIYMRDGQPWWDWEDEL